jgi:glycerol-3-phosphate dehydrogenase
MVQSLQVDVVIVGGGIAGLWTLSRLRQQGVNAILLEADALGAGQTSCSQGIIHGGVKYALNGLLNKSTQAIAAMPDRWQACLQGSGEIDLQQARILSKAQYLWSTGTALSKFSQLVASKLLKSRCQRLNSEAYPPIFQSDYFKGQVYQLNEMVLDVTSLLQIFSQTLGDWILKITSKQLNICYEDQAIKHIDYCLEGEPVRLTANHYVMAAGAGNEALLQGLTEAPTMQRRPLRMTVMQCDGLLPLYAHCLGMKGVPRMTITSHPATDGRFVWYVGGQPAETGVEKTVYAHEADIQQELMEILPWVSLKNCKMHSFLIDRAEARQVGGLRPETATVKQVGNVIIAWPTKLAFAPVVSDRVLALVGKNTAAASTEASLLARWPKAQVAKSIGDRL